MRVEPFHNLGGKVLCFVVVDVSSFWGDLIELVHRVRQSNLLHKIRILVLDVHIGD
jgi:hypothetical protein